VKQIFAPTHTVQTRQISGKPDEVADQLMEYLKEEHLIERITHE
jgi:alkanesulfonate monooxygenase SsuD/methylene tetrahydromethanopterin reductase-like flavin-dependent oxidoreductase (luciferase family)